MAIDLSKYQHTMNSALDHDLSEPEWEALNTHLIDAPEIAAYWERLQQVDRLLRTTPMVAPSPGFAERVMAAIAVMHLPTLANRPWGVGVALGLVAAAILTIPVLSALLILLLSVITDPGTLNALLQAITTGVSHIVDLAHDLEHELHEVTETPMLPALLTTVIPISMLWVWLIWYVSGGPQWRARRQIT